MIEKKPIDDAYDFLLVKLKKEGYKKLTNRIMVKETEQWLFFVQFSSILKTRPWTGKMFRNGFWCEVGAFLKGAAHPTMTIDKSLYKNYPANSVTDCHFRRFLMPPYLLRNYKAPQYFHAALWTIFRSKNLKALENIFYNEIQPWTVRLNNLNDVKVYVEEILDSNFKASFRKENQVKWGNLSGVKQLKEFFIASHVPSDRQQ